jgi:hypothetical protein
MMRSLYRQNPISYITLFEGGDGFRAAGPILPGFPRDPETTVNKLLAVLDTQELAAAWNGSTRGSGLRW